MSKKVYKEVKNHTENTHKTQFLSICIKAKHKKKQHKTQNSQKFHTKPYGDQSNHQIKVQNQIETNITRSISTQ